MSIAERAGRQFKRMGEDVSMYWNATRFLWRVFTHPRSTRVEMTANSYVRATAVRAQIQGVRVAKKHARS